MLRLSNEILSYIFEYLSYSDIKVIRLVCRRFYAATYCKRIVANESLVITDHLMRKGPQVLINCKRSVNYCTIKNILITFDIYYNLLINILPKIKHLSLIQCNSEKLNLMQILKYCHNVESLRIENCDYGLTVDGLLNAYYGNIELIHLRSLLFVNTQLITDAVLCRFIKMCPKLEELSLQECYINSHQGVYNRFYKSNNRKHPADAPSDCILTIQCIINLVEKKAKQIKSIDFSGNPIKSNDLLNIFRIKELKLESIDMNECRELKGDLQLGAWQRNLTNLNLSHCNIVNNGMMQDICLNMKNLTVLQIACCNNVSDEGLQHLKELRKLITINVSNCLQITSLGITNNLCLDIYPTMRHINISRIHIKNPDFDRLTKSFVNLITLDLSGCEALVDQNFQNIFTNLIFLRKLLLVKLLISNTGLMGINYNNGGNKTSISNLAGLYYLDLSECQMFTDDLFKFDFNLKELKVLNLSKTKITINGLRFLSQKCPAIEKLDLSYCTITDNVIYILLQGSHRLEYLYLKKCMELTNGTLEAILLHGKCLKHLDLTGCSYMDEILIEDVMNTSTIRTLIKPLTYKNSIEEHHIPVVPSLNT